MTDAEMISIVCLHEAGQSWRQIGASLQRSSTGCFNCYENWRVSQELRRSWGRPRAIGETPIEIVLQETQADRRSTLVDVASAAGTSRETARGIRHENGYHYYESVAVPRLSAENKRARVAFAEAQIAQHDRLPIIFTDESMVAQNLNKGGIWRKRGEILVEGFYERDHHPLSVMVWGAIGIGFRGPLMRCPPSVNQEVYRDILARSGIFQALCDRFGQDGFWWQQDNAPPHQPVQKELARMYKVLKWPPYSPDLSPIEQLWALIKRKLTGRRFTNAHELFEAMAQAWEEISQEQIDSLCSSFQARCVVCARHNGDSLNGHWTEVHQVHHRPLTA
jgi:hypothetical protein